MCSRPGARTVPRIIPRAVHDAYVPLCTCSAQSFSSLCSLSSLLTRVQLCIGNLYHFWHARAPAAGRGIQGEPPRTAGRRFFSTCTGSGTPIEITIEIRLKSVHRPNFSPTYPCTHTHTYSPRIVPPTRKSHCRGLAHSARLTNRRDRSSTAACSPVALPPSLSLSNAPGVRLYERRVSRGQLGYRST